jgi:hypothetical protein
MAQTPRSSNWFGPVILPCMHFRVFISTSILSLDSKLPNSRVRTSSFFFPSSLISLHYQGNGIFVCLNTQSNAWCVILSLQLDNLQKNGLDLTLWPRMGSTSCGFKQKMSGSPSTSEKNVTTQLKFGIYSV